MIFLPLASRTLYYGAPINRQHPLNRGLLSEWSIVPLGGKGNTFFDLAGRNHGTLTNGPTWVGAIGRPSGFGGISLVAASSHHIPTANLSVGGTWTITAWVYYRSGSCVIGQYDGGGSATFYLRLGGHSGFSTGGSFKELSTTEPTANVWTHVALTADGTNLTYYRNGVQINQGAASGTPDTGGGTAATIGRVGSSSSNYLDAIVDEVRVLSRAYAQHEVYQQFMESSLGNPSRLSWISTRTYFGVTAAAGGNRRRRFLMCAGS